MDDITRIQSFFGSEEFLGNVAEAISELLTNPNTETTTHQTTITVPRPYDRIIDQVCQGIGIEKQAVLGQMASQGLSIFLKQTLQKQQQPTPEPVNAAPVLEGLNIPGLEKIEGSLSQLGDLAKQLDSIKEAVNHVNRNFDIDSEIKKNSK